MIKQTTQLINGNPGNLELKYKNVDFLDLIESTKKCYGGQSEILIRYPNSRLFNMKNVKCHLKNKLENLKLQTVDYKPHFKNPCFNCPSSFHCSSFEDGHFNLQKMFDVEHKCDTCQKYYTKERSFYHNCNICNVSFKNCKILKHHRMREHNSKKPDQCAVCYLSQSPNDIPRHIRKHKLPHKCLYCNKRYAFKINLKSHIQSHAGENPYSCKYCPKQFRAKQYLDIHQYEHTGQKSYSYCYTRKKYQFKSTLAYRLLEHTGGKKWKCFLCDKTFNTESALNIHKRIHGNLEFLHEDIDFLDLIKLERCTGKLCEKSKFHIGCSNCRLSHTKDLKDYLKNKIENLQLQTVDYKSHFKKPCYNCSFSFHSSIFADGHLNLQKMFDVGNECDICQKYLTMDRSFHHKCNICKSSFTNCKLLILHHRIEHNMKKPGQCAACYRSFTYYALLPHTYKHTLPHICQYCNKRYAMKINLESHMLSHTGEKPFSCKYCPKLFQLQRSLNLHLLKHTGEKIFKCDICCRTYFTQYVLNRHKLVHLERPFQCKDCPKNYKTQNALDIHLFEHNTGGKQLKCDLCDKTFGRRYSVLRHRRKHLLKFHCKYCRKQYKTKKFLNYHLLEHTGGKKFKCDLCDKTFAAQTFLEQHKFSHMEKSIQCSICSKLYKSPRGLRRHINRIHK